MNKNKTILEILKYQKKKNKLTKKYANIELIPYNVQLSYNEIDKNLKKIKKNFFTSCHLQKYNCLHCNIYNDNDLIGVDSCLKCPYYKQNDCCKSEYKTTYFEVMAQIDMLSERKQEKFGNKLLKIGEKLEKKLKKHKGKK